MEERVQKFISQAGVASRRKAEEFIKSGQVLINGRKAKLGDKVNPSTDIVKVYGKTVKPNQQLVYIMINKPKGYVVSKSDPQHRKTVFELLPEDLRTKVWNVGRLDADTEGLLILTNDGELTQELSHPKYEHEKEYEVSLQESPSESQLEQLRSGVEIATGTTYPAQVKQRDGKVRITIHEGKKRQVRRMFTTVGLTITNLKRIRINKLLLPKELPAGQFKLISKEEIL
ncbi:MAG: rRNA pseudouridine synthase [Candidatus Doudnabacteria bacterium]|nr:rRNA pseudouridine synthase [Candidatus Doudnabacteria bacterium]